jgi:hypothetical protein
MTSYYRGLTIYGRTKEELAGVIEPVPIPYPYHY